MIVASKRYVNLGSGTVNCVTAACLTANGGAAVPISVSLTENLFRLGVNYKFSFGEPELGIRRKSSFVCCAEALMSAGSKVRPDLPMLSAVIAHSQIVVTLPDATAQRFPANFDAVDGL